MQVCTSLQTGNHASTPPLSFYRPDALPAAQPNSVKALKAPNGKQNNHECTNVVLNNIATHLADYTGNDTVPIQLAQCRFPGLAISNVKI